MFFDIAGALGSAGGPMAQTLTAIQRERMEEEEQQRMMRFRQQELDALMSRHGDTMSLEERKLDSADARFDKGLAHDMEMERVRHKYAILRDQAGYTHDEALERLRQSGAMDRIDKEWGYRDASQVRDIDAREKLQGMSDAEAWRRAKLQADPMGIFLRDDTPATRGGPAFMLPESGSGVPPSSGNGVGSAPAGEPPAQLGFFGGMGRTLGKYWGDVRDNPMSVILPWDASAREMSEGAYDRFGKGWRQAQIDSLMLKAERGDITTEEQKLLDRLLSQGG